MDGDFGREFDINLLSKTLPLHQRLKGDVSCVVWDVSIVLAKYLEKLCQKGRHFLENLNVVGLGSGVGCVGLTAACFGGNAEVVPLNWGENTKINFVPDLILLADCVYYKKSIDCLVRTLRDLATPRTKIFLSQEVRDSEKQRDCWRYFVRRISQHFKLHDVPLDEQNADYSSPDILLMRLAKL